MVGVIAVAVGVIGAVAVGVISTVTLMGSGGVTVAVAVKLIVSVISVVVVIVADSTGDAVGVASGVATLILQAATNNAVANKSKIDGVFFIRVPFGNGDLGLFI